MGNVAQGGLGARPIFGQKLIRIQAQELGIVTDKAPYIHLAGQVREAFLFERVQKGASYASSFFDLLEREAFALAGFAEQIAKLGQSVFSIISRAHFDNQLYTRKLAVSKQTADRQKTRQIGLRYET